VAFLAQQESAIARPDAVDGVMNGECYRWVWRPKADEYPIPHGGLYHPYILRRWRPALLHPKGETQICHRAEEQNALDCFPFPNKGANQTSSPEKAANPWPMRKTYLTQS
jgi:hypothetical protein